MVIITKYAYQQYFLQLSRPLLKYCENMMMTTYKTARKFTTFLKLLRV